MCFHCRTCWIMCTYKFLIFLFNCYIDIMKFTNTLLNDLRNFCHRKPYYFFICKPFSIDNYEMTNVLTCSATY